MALKEREQLVTKFKEVTSEMAKLKKAIEKNKKNLAEADKVIVEENELFHLDAMVSKKTKDDKSMDDVFIMAAEDGHLHLDVSSGSHTVVDLDPKHNSSLKS